MQIPEIDYFLPYKVKITKSLGLIVKWHVPRQVGEAEYKDGFEKDSQNQPHPDLINHITDMIEPIRQMHECTFQDMKIVELEISGESSDEALKVKAEFKFHSGQKSTLVTHFIKLNDDNYGIESKVWASLESLKAELYEYVFNDKYAQGTLFSSGSNQEEETQEGQETSEAEQDDSENQSEE